MRVRAHRSTAEAHHGALGRWTLLALAALASVLVGVWGVAKLAEDDWFIGAAFVACGVIGLARVLGRVVRSARSR